MFNRLWKVHSLLFIDIRDQTSDNTMTRISQNAIKSGFFAISGRNSGEMEREFHYYLKKRSQFAGLWPEIRNTPAFAGVNLSP
jgi:hypothetical protein